MTIRELDTVRVLASAALEVLAGLGGFLAGLSLLVLALGSLFRRRNDP